FERIVTFHQHIPAPITDADDERLDLEIRGRFPRAEYLQNSLLCIFVLDGRTLRTFVPSDHVLHDFSPLSHFVICPVVYRDGLAIGHWEAWGKDMDRLCSAICTCDGTAHFSPIGQSLISELPIPLAVSVELMPRSGVG